MPFFTQNLAYSPLGSQNSNPEMNLDLASVNTPRALTAHMQFRGKKFIGNSKFTGQQKAINNEVRKNSNDFEIPLLNEKIVSLQSRDDDLMSK